MGAGLKFGIKRKIALNFTLLLMVPKGLLDQQGITSVPGHHSPYHATMRMVVPDPIWQTSCFHQRVPLHKRNCKVVVSTRFMGALLQRKAATVQNRILWHVNLNGFTPV